MNEGFPAIPIGVLDPAEVKILELWHQKLKLTMGAFHVFLLGGTGSGKSTLLNNIAGCRVVESGVVRPTTQKIQVWCHSSLGQDLGALGLEPITHEQKEWQNVVFWDFPDMDSWQVDHHGLNWMFRQYADLILLVLHPEKYQQQSLLELCSWYPTIEKRCLITHGKSIPSRERGRLNQEIGNLPYPAELVDLIEEPERAKELVRNMVAPDRPELHHQYKASNLKQLTSEVDPLLAKVKQSLLVQTSALEEETALIQSKKGSFETLVEGQTIEIWHARIFAEKRGDLLEAIGWSSRSWAAWPAGWILSFWKKPPINLNAPWFSMPWLLVEQVFEGRLELAITRESFIIKHQQCGDLVGGALKQAALFPGLITLGMDLLEWVLLFWFSWRVLFDPAILLAPWMSAFLWLLGVFGLVFFHCARSVFRLKNLYFAGLKQYGRGLSGLLKELMNSNLQSLEDRRSHLLKLWSVHQTWEKHRTGLLGAHGIKTD